MKRGDIVLVDWPFSDRTGSKVRPALVVQGDYLNGLIADTVLLPITRTIRAPFVTEVIVDPFQEKQSGLLHRSVISCNNFLTLDQGLILKTIGTLSNPVMKMVDSCLKVALELP